MTALLWVINPRRSLPCLAAFVLLGVWAHRATEREIARGAGMGGGW